MIMTASRKQGRKNAARKTAAYTTFLAYPRRAESEGCPRQYSAAAAHGRKKDTSTPSACSLQGHTTYRIGVMCYTAPPRQEKRALLPALCSRFSGKATAQRARRSAPRSDRARPCGDAGFYELPPRKEVRKSHGFPMRRSSFRPIKRKEQNYENKANHNKTRRR